MEGFFNSFNMKEDEAHSGFDPEGVFNTHMVSIIYTLVFNRLEEITEWGDDNEENHIKAKVISTPRKTTPKKKNQATHEDAHTRESSNVGAMVL